MAEELKEKNPIDEFVDILSHWINSYKSQICTYLAIKTNGKIRLKFGRIIFNTNTLQDSKLDFHVETKHLIAGRKIKRIETNTIEQLLCEAKEGQIKFSEYSFILDKPFIRFDPIYHSKLSSPHGPRLPNLTISGSERIDIDSQLFDWELRSADQPFDSIDELLGYLWLPRLREMGDAYRIEIIANPPALISNKSKISDGQVSVILNVAIGIDVSKIKAGFKVFNKNNIDRFSINGGKVNWVKNEDLISGNYSFKIEDSNLIQAFVSYDNVALHSWYVTDPQKQMNHRYSIHSLFDKNLDTLKRLLFEERNTFEYGVALLLNILGFSVSHHGKIPKLQDGPDIIALTPIGNIGVIECTSGLLDKDDKLAKLVQRTNLIRKKLVETGFGYLLVQPVIITMLTRNEVSGHLEEACKHDIAVVCKEELTKLLNRATIPPDPEGLFKEAIRLIPENEHHDNH